MWYVSAPFSLCELEIRILWSKNSSTWTLMYFFVSFMRPVIETLVWHYQHMFSPCWRVFQPWTFSSFSMFRNMQFTPCSDRCGVSTWQRNWNWVRTKMEKTRSEGKKKRATEDWNQLLCCLGKYKYPSEQGESQQKNKYFGNAVLSASEKQLQKIQETVAEAKIVLRYI